MHGRSDFMGTRFRRKMPGFIKIHSSILIAAFKDFNPRRQEEGVILQPRSK